MVKFGTLEYYQQVADALNKNADWMKAALTTNFMYVYTDVFNADGTPKAFLIDIKEGKVTASEAKAADLSKKEIEFGSTATYAMQAGIAKGEINAQKAKLKLAMMKAMKHQGTLKIQAQVMKDMKGVEY